MSGSGRSAITLPDGISDPPDIDIPIHVEEDNIQGSFRNYLNRQFQLILANIMDCCPWQELNNARLERLEVHMDARYELRGFRASAEDNNNPNHVHHGASIMNFGIDRPGNPDREVFDFDTESEVDDDPSARHPVYSAAANLLGFLPKIDMDKLPPDGETCPVCTERFGASDRPISLKCKHVVGRACIEQWIRSGNNSCPLCRAAIFEPAR